MPRKLLRAIALLALLLGGCGAAHAQAYGIATRDPQVPAITGYLSLPPGRGPFPAVVLFHGLRVYATYTGTFAVLTEHYNRMGIATLAVDWGSARNLRNGGPLGIGTMESVIEDAFAANAFLRSLPVIRPDKIFFEGFSLGGYVAKWVTTAQNENRRDRFAGAIGFSPRCNQDLRTVDYAAPVVLVLPDASDASPQLCAVAQGRPNLDIVLVHSTVHDYYEDHNGEPWKEALRHGDAMIAAVLAR
ncbi:MAG: alpha/beta hydrolase [Bradyrhizobium sp.]|nr:alpha/beta hydrolase [Bradyrhizobium sp.]